MAVLIEPTPASGQITAKKTVVRFDISGATGNDAGNYNALAYPTQPELRYVLTMVVGGEEVGRSQVFGVTPDGDFTFNGYIFPEAGSYTVQLYDVTDPDNPSAVLDPASVTVA